MKLIVGLGNPGEKYANVRHNLGFMVLDELAKRGKRKGESWKFEKKFKSEIFNLTLNASRFTLAKPQTYMNNSGMAVKAIADYYKINPENIVIIHDELDLPLGKIRIRKGGSSAGHHGIESIMEALKTDQFWRVRLGIGPAKGPAEKFVLDPLTSSENPKVKHMIKEAIKAIDSKLLYI